MENTDFLKKIPKDDLSLLSKFSTREKAFLLTLRLFTSLDWKGNKRELAKRAGISFGYLSENTKFQKVCKPKKQERLAEILAPSMTFEEFINMGMGILGGSSSDTSSGDSQQITQFGDVLKRRHQDVAAQFQDQELATEINKDLLEIEKKDPQKLQEIKGFIKGILAGLKEDQEQKNGTLRLGE